PDPAEGHVQVDRERAGRHTLERRGRERAVGGGRIARGERGRHTRQSPILRSAPHPTCAPEEDVCAVYSAGTGPVEVHRSATGRPGDGPGPAGGTRQRRAYARSVMVRPASVPRRSKRVTGRS